jgi:site-specific DNA recombinase
MAPARKTRPDGADEPSAPRRVLVAARISRVTVQGRSRIERDDESAQKWAAAQGDRTVVAVSEDSGVSGATDPFKRASLGRYLSDPALLATYDEIVASSLDRLGRSARDLARLRDWAEDTNKILTILNPRLHWPPAPDDLAQGFVWDVLGRVAEVELRIISKRYADQRQDYLDRGVLLGKPGFGFEVVGEKGDKTLKPIPGKVPYLLGMIERALRNDTLLSIGRWLDAESIEPVHGGKWHPQSVANVLRSPALKGRRLDGSGRVLMKHEGVMSVSDWAALQAALNKRPHRRGPVTEATPCLTGSIVCDVCGGPMLKHRSTGQTRKDGTRDILFYYRCKGSDKTPSQCRNMIRLEDADRYVDRLFTDEDGSFEDVQIVERVTVPGDDHAAEIADVVAELRELDFDDPQFDEKLAALRAERTRLMALPGAPARIEERPTGRTVGEVWPTLGDAARRRYLLAAGVKVHVRPRHAGPPGADWLSLADDLTHKHYCSITGDPTHVAGTLRTIAVDLPER